MTDQGERRKEEIRRCGQHHAKEKRGHHPHPQDNNAPDKGAGQRHDDTEHFDHHGDFSLREPHIRVERVRHDSHHDI